MNPLRQLSNIVSLMIALLVIGWFGLTCFKAGWYARNQPVFSPILLKFLDPQQSSKDG
jgi:hypothetical protein